MAQKISRKTIRRDLKHDEFVEAAFDLGHWIEENWKTVVGIVAAAVVVAMLAVGWVSWRGHRREQARVSFYEGYRLYEEAKAAEAETPRSELLSEAAGKFEEAERRAGSTPLADVAAFYRGVAHLERGEAADAVHVLEGVAARADVPAVADTVKAALAEAHAAAGQADQAVELWRQLADNEASFFPEDRALLNLGRLLREQGRAEEARGVFQELQDRFPQSPATAEFRTISDDL